MKLRSKIVGMVLAGAVAVALGALGVGTAQADGEAHPIRNPNGNCLQPEGGSTDFFVPIVQMPCDGSNEQRWFFQSLGSNRYQFSNLVSHLCFDAFDGAFNGARLLQNQCAPISNDQWKTSRTLPDLVTIMSRVGFRDTNFCVDVPLNAPTPGLAMQLFRCNTTDAQKWLVGFG